MNGQEKLFIIALVVSIFVIIGLAIVFSFLFFLYSFYKVNHINVGLEDKSLKKEYRNRIYKINVNKRKRNKSFITCEEMIKKEEVIQKRLHILMDIFSGIIIVILISISSVGLTYRLQGDQIYINNTTYLTILSGSMEERNEENDYLFENNLTNQIDQYSLIGIDKVNSEDELKLYDVVAYKHEDVLIIHRIIEIKENEDNNRVYTLRGDSNSVSLSYETELEYKDIIGKYNGFNNYGLGVFITYIKSEIGLIALSSAFIFLFLATLAEERINKAYKNRLDSFILCKHYYNKSSSIYFIEEDLDSLYKEVVIVKDSNNNNNDSDNDNNELTSTIYLIEDENNKKIKEK